MCSSVWYKHSLLPGSLILPWKKKAVKCCCQCSQMRPPRMKTCSYEHEDSLVCSYGHVGTMMATLLGWLWFDAPSVHSYSRNTFMTLENHTNLFSPFKFPRFQFKSVWESNVDEVISTSLNTLSGYSVHRLIQLYSHFGWCSSICCIILTDCP